MSAEQIVRSEKIRNQDHMRIHRLSAGLLAVGLLTACGSSVENPAPSPASTTGTTTRATNSAAVFIHVSKFEYAVPASVSPGATVTVMNMDAEAHTVTADSGSTFDVTAAPGAEKMFTAPMKPGKYPFHCTFHSNMHGVLVVQ